ncbi:proteinase-activated receptor 2 isoform X2 [Rana temporaria]|uniref:proteinase-activated receptor 2 isoform X2 n=1 Tax=Rana temporaria TaxID=8407 RepID=UPI001AACAD44|nr:proteinase-activated receptor 2 isoform X2 [Rana temporaria]
MRGPGLLCGAVLLSVCVLAVTGQNTTKGGRRFIGKDGSFDNITGKYGYTVDDFAKKVLTGGLTRVFLPLVYIIVFAVGLPSNAIALWVFLFRTKKKHPAVIYMANLAVADLMFVIWIPLKISYHLNGNNWIYGEGLCKVLVGFFYGNMYCSILFITCLSVQRYWVIVNPISHTRKKTKLAFIVSATIWVVILLSTIPLYLAEQTVYVSNVNITTCHDVLPLSVLASDMFNYFLSLAIGLFFFPAVLITVAYVVIIRTLNASITDENIGKKRKKAIVLIILVLIMCLVCFLPSNILLLVNFATIKENHVGDTYAFYIVALCFSSLNSCIDPFVYYFVSKDFRDNVKNTFLCRSVRTVERMQISFSSMKYSRKNTYTSSSSNTKTSTC